VNKIGAIFDWYYFMKLKSVYIALFMMFLMGCSSMHSPSYKTSHPRNNDNLMYKTDTSKDLINNPNNNKDFISTSNQNKSKTRFQDTNVVDLPILVASRDTNMNVSNGTEIVSTRQSAIDMFDTALQDFDKQNFKECCSKFNTIAETFLPTDSLYFEAKFYESECKIVDNKVVDAKFILESLYSDANTPSCVRERVTVRLGQIQCLFDNIEEAKKYFAELKAKYPKSIYLKVANCNSITQPSK